MSKNCKSCGKEYSGNYCNHCGYGNPDLKIKAYEKYKYEKPERFLSDEEKAQLSEKKKSHTKKVNQSTSNSQSGTIANKKTSGWSFFVLVICVFAIIIFAVLYKSGKIFLPASKDDVIKTYFASIADCDFDGYVSTMIKPVAVGHKDEMSDANYSKNEYMKKLYADYTEGYGDGYSATVKINSYTVMLDIDITASEYTLKQAYNKKYNISEAFEANVDVSYNGSKKNETVNYLVYVAKIGRNWYILNIE